MLQRKKRTSLLFIRNLGEAAGPIRSLWSRNPVSIFPRSNQCTVLSFLQKGLQTKGGNRFLRIFYRSDQSVTNIRNGKRRTYCTQPNKAEILPASQEQSGMEPQLKQGWREIIFHPKNFGHFASILSLSAFLVTDILWLRLLSIASSCFFIAFNVFYTKVWLSIRWSVVFMTINAIQIIRILMDRKAVEFDEQEREIYESIFSRIFTEVEFRKLLLAAEVVTFLKGEEIVRQGEDTDNIYLILNGECIIERAQQNGDSKNGNHTNGESPKEKTRAEVPETPGVVDTLLRSLNLFQGMKDRRDVQRRERKEQLRREEEEKLHSTTIGFMKDGELIGEFELLNNHGEHKKEIQPARQRFDGTIPLTTPTSTVRAVEQTKCLMWTQESLKALLLRNPTMCVGWNAFISYSLMSKLEEQRHASREKNYRVFIFGILVDGIVNKDEKEAVKRYRRQNNIPKDMHESVLHELGWTVADYKRGYLSKVQERKNREDFAKQEELHAARHAIPPASAEHSHPPPPPPPQPEREEEHKEEHQQHAHKPEHGPSHIPSSLTPPGIPLTQPFDNIVIPEPSLGNQES